MDRNISRGWVVKEDFSRFVGGTFRYQGGEPQKILSFHRESAERGDSFLIITTEHEAIKMYNPIHGIIMVDGTLVGNYASICTEESKQFAIMSPNPNQEIKVDWWR